MNLYDVVCLRGTGAPLTGDGVQATFLAELPKDRFRQVDVNYPASYGNPAYNTSFERGVHLALDAIRKSPRRCILFGFSQGADIAGYVHALLNGTISDSRFDTSMCWVDASFLVADPSRPKGSRPLNNGGNVGGWGIRGSRPIGLNSWQVANPGDPICAYVDGPLRSLADFSGNFGDPEAVKKNMQLVEKKMLQPWWNPASWRDWGGTFAWLGNYMYKGKHTDDYVRLGHAKLLGQKAREVCK